MKIELDGFKQMPSDYNDRYYLEHETVSVEELEEEKIKFSTYHHEIGSKDIIISKSDLKKILKVFEE